MAKPSQGEVASLHSKMLRKFTILDVMCPVCRGILIEPVTMPCYHSLCKLCFERTMEEASLSCPMCRKRIGGWFRKNSKTGKLIDSKFWKKIKMQFPQQVGARLKGEDDGIPEDVIAQFAPQPQLCNSGEIRKEYEEDIKKLHEEARRRQEDEEKKSVALITQLQEEELQLRLRLKQAEIDEQLARQLQKEASQNLTQTGCRDRDKENNVRTSVAGAMPAPNKGPMDAFLSLKKTSDSSKCLSPTDLNNKLKANTPATGKNDSASKPRCPSNMSAGSHDSIHQEMHHFKPIRAVPRTPPKRLSDGRVLEPKLIKSIPRNLNEIYDKMVVSGKSHCTVSVTRLRQCTDLSSPSSSSSHNEDVGSAFAGFGSSSGCAKKRDRTSLWPGGKEAKADETPTKRAREDYTTDTGLYGQQVCEGQKVITIIQKDAIAEVGGHTRRFDADLKPEERPASVGRVGNDSDSSDTNFEDPDVAHIIGVEPEYDPAQKRTSTDSGALERTLSRLATATNNNVSKLMYGSHEEQLRIEQMIRQERADYELALRLDQHWASLDRKVDRTKGSPRAYELRNARRVHAGRQSTLDEFSTMPRLKHC